MKTLGTEESKISINYKQRIGSSRVTIAFAQCTERESCYTSGVYIIFLNKGRFYRRSRSWLRVNHAINKFNHKMGGTLFAFHCISGLMT